MVRCDDDALIVIPAQAGIFCLVEYFHQCFVPGISRILFERTFGGLEHLAIQSFQEKRDAVRFCECLHKCSIPVGSAFAQPVMHMSNP